MEEEIGHNESFAKKFVSEQKDNKTLLYKNMLSLPASLLSYKAKTRGYVTTHVSACVSGLDAMNAAARRIQTGEAHTAITGGVDTYFVCRMILQAFSLAKALAVPDEREDIEKAVKPFDKLRTHPVLGEGACVFILESKERALMRNARMYCEFIPGVQGNEHTNIAFTPEKSGKTWAKVIQDSIKNMPIDHINAHSPGDKIIDKIEAQAFDQVFGKGLAKKDITSIKATTGGGNAFTSSCQVAATAMAIHEQLQPPTANYQTHDPELGAIHPLRHVL